ncbi:MAG TPA: ATP-grasp domain-containing protein [Candidatus Nanoarchaeia archaeon]|nr:ATP-grasp domain-containing protein [Candidatus Nanoarchaeia archaeon]
MNEKEKRIPVLITGVGGQLGQSIVKSIRLSKIGTTIIGTDCDSLSAGLYRIDKAYIVPQAHERSYIPTLIKIIQENSIELVLVGSDKEVETLAEHKKEIEGAGTKILVSDKSVIQVGDKWELVEFLKENGLNYPETARADDDEAVKKLMQKGFPLIVKTCRGSGSKQVHRVQNEEELQLVLKKMPDAIVQELLLPDEEEYTYGSYHSGDGIIGHMLLKRELMGGLTGKCRVVNNAAIEKYAESIITKLRPEGPCNIQMRLTKRGPVAFEINPRFSSTVIIQAKCGFNAPELALRDKIMKKPIEKQQIRKLIALRFYEELYITEDEHNKMKAQGMIDKPKSEVNYLL